MTTALTINPPLLVELHAAADPVLAVLGGQRDAEGEGRVGDVVVEVVLLPHRHTLHVIHVHLHRQGAHPLLLVNHVFPHLEMQVYKIPDPSCAARTYHEESRVVVSWLVMPVLLGVVDQLHLGEVHAVIVGFQDFLELKWRDYNLLHEDETVTDGAGDHPLGRPELRMEN